MNGGVDGTVAELVISDGMFLLARSQTTFYDAEVLKQSIEEKRFTPAALKVVVKHRELFEIEDNGISPVGDSNRIAGDFLSKQRDGQRITIDTTRNLLVLHCTGSRNSQTGSNQGSVASEKKYPVFLRKHHFEQIDEGVTESIRDLKMTNKIPPSTIQGVTMLNFTRFAAFSILALCFSRFSLGSDWEYHQFADGKYMMSFPTTPKTIMQKTPDGIDFPVLMCNRNSAALGVSWKPISKYREHTPTSRSLAKDMLNSLESNFKNYDLLYVNPITYAGWVGADLGASVVAKDAETRLYYRQRFISTETHLIQIIYTDSTRMPLEPWVGDIFYNSLTTVDE